MKTIIKSTVAVLALGLLSTGAFAAGKPKAEEPVKAKKDVVLFTSLAQEKFGVGVIIHKAAPSKSVVTIFDNAGNQIYKDVMSKTEDVVLKGYQLSALDEGDYTIKVTSNKQEVKKLIHVYTDENDQKTFFFMQ